MESDQISVIKEKLSGGFDVSVRQIRGKTGRVTLVYVDELVNKDTLARDVVTHIGDLLETSESDCESVRAALCVATPVSIAEDAAAAADQIAMGMVVIVCQHGPMLVTELKQIAQRSVTEPPTGTSVKGPREGFTEDLRTNISLLRRRLKTGKLALDKMTLGKYTGTEVVVTYLSDIAKPSIVKAIKKRLAAINIDGILDSSYLTAQLERHNHSLFRQIGTTEKPDILAAKLLEGRVGILVDGTPICLTLPFLFIEDLQDGDDYYKRDYRIAFERIIRVIGAILAVILPAAYVALQEFQYQLIPLRFVVTLLNASSGIPLTPTLEMLLVLILFEVLNETSVRMPKYVGMAISVVGAIVLGDTAVNAGLLSSPAVLITAISGIGLYCVPDDSGTFSLLRILFVGVAGVMGIFGLTLALVAVMAYLTRIDSYGTPYLAPYAPFVAEDIKDGILQNDVTDMEQRPKSFPHLNNTRMRSGSATASDEVADE